MYKCNDNCCYPYQLSFDAAGYSHDVQHYASECLQRTKNSKQHKVKFHGCTAHYDRSDHFPAPEDLRKETRKCKNIGITKMNEACKAYQGNDLSQYNFKSTPQYSTSCKPLLQHPLFFQPCIRNVLQHDHMPTDPNVGMQTHALHPITNYLPFVAIQPTNFACTSPWFYLNGILLPNYQSMFYQSFCTAHPISQNVFCNCCPLTKLKCQCAPNEQPIGRISEKRGTYKSDSLPHHQDSSPRSETASDEKQGNSISDVNEVNISKFNDKKLSKHSMSPIPSSDYLITPRFTSASKMYDENYSTSPSWQNWERCSDLLQEYEVLTKEVTQELEEPRKGALILHENKTKNADIPNVRYLNHKFSAVKSAISEENVPLIELNECSFKSEFKPNSNSANKSKMECKWEIIRKPSKVFKVKNKLEDDKKQSTKNVKPGKIKNDILTEILEKYEDSNGSNIHDQFTRLQSKLNGINKNARSSGATDCTDLKRTSNLEIKGKVNARNQNVTTEKLSELSMIDINIKTKFIDDGLNFSQKDVRHNPSENIRDYLEIGKVAKSKPLYSQFMENEAKIYPRAKNETKEMKNTISQEKNEIEKSKSQHCQRNSLNCIQPSLKRGRERKANKSMQFTRHSHNALKTNYETDTRGISQENPPDVAKVIKTLFSKQLNENRIKIGNLENTSRECNSKNLKENIDEMLCGKNHEKISSDDRYWDDDELIEDSWGPIISLLVNKIVPLKKKKEDPTSQSVTNEKKINSSISSNHAPNINSDLKFLSKDSETESGIDSE